MAEQCERCKQPIEGRSVKPGFGFGAFHVLCWAKEEREIKDEHIQSDADDAARE